ncbi:MAG: RNA 2',3'-cyclic phosphodiesterase [Anaerolineae bacterium]|nr:RNA 2',3'-cyclic phosphodiesterase [Anaerolineae bacterium]
MPPPQTIRTFIAIELAPEIKEELGRVSKLLAGQLPAPQVRWVHPENMHLTLRFLGETAVTQLPQLVAELDKVGQHHTPFSLQLARLGCFPNRKRPRVIWVGIAGEDTALMAVKQVLDQRLMSLGWAAEDKPFNAHLTIGRVPDGRPVLDRLPATLNWETAVKPLSFTIAALHLIESQLTPKGPLYTVRHTAVLR